MWNNGVCNTDIISNTIHYGMCEDVLNSQKFQLYNNLGIYLIRKHLFQEYYKLYG